MMRLPFFRYLAPRTVAEATRILAGSAPGEAMLLAGGTDLLPNMKRRQQVPATIIGLRGIGELRETANGRGLRLGAGLTLSDVVADARVKDSYAALWQAAAQVATPHLRNMGTLGGNLCLDTRCNYYDQNYEWRKSIDFCMKKDGKICWVATSSPRCLAVSSTDTAPALVALGARVRLVSKRGERVIPLEDLYANDGIHYLTRKPDEILVEVMLGPSEGRSSALPPRVASTMGRIGAAERSGVARKSRRAGSTGANRGPQRRDASGSSAGGAVPGSLSRGEIEALPAGEESSWRSAYWKLRRRGSFDFPVLSAAAAVRIGRGEVVEEARIVLGAVASRPLLSVRASAHLTGKKLTDGVIAEAADLAWEIAKPMDNTDFVYHWRKRVSREFVSYALCEVRGDDMRETRLRIARQDLLQIL